MPVKYVKMIKDGKIEKIQEDRVERFLEVGFELVEASTRKKSQSSKDKISATAQVTSISEEEADEDWDPLTDEPWAESAEAVFAPEGERLTDSDSEYANEED